MSDLRKIAEAAKEGSRWYLDEALERTCPALLPTEVVYIAAWSPDRALAALDVVEAAREDYLDRHAGDRRLAEDCGSRNCARMRAALDRWEALTTNEAGQPAS